MGKMEMKDAYLLFKDHKLNFDNNQQLRLINHSKTDLGQVSKNIIKKIIVSIKETSFYNHSSDAIKWFRNIRNKNKATFIQFDIDFYLCISKDLLLKSIDYVLTINLPRLKVLIVTLTSLWICSNSQSSGNLHLIHS